VSSVDLTSAIVIAAAPGGDGRRRFPRCGFDGRGAVRAAPARLGTAVPDRDLIVFVTSIVIGVTLLVQAPLLPRVVRWAGIGKDNAADEERRRAEIDDEVLRGPQDHLDQEKIQASRRREA
jgi:NhaP-type Na+/H+ or K+/H+ antiporter